MFANEDKLILECNCQDEEFIKFVKWEYDDDWSIYTSITGAEIYGFKAKLKAIWNIIRFGTYENYGLIIKDDIPKLIEWLSAKTPLNT